MSRETPLARLVRGVLLTIVGLFFLFPIVWVFLMSFQTNATILRIPPSLLFSPTLDNYVALISGRLETQAGTCGAERVIGLTARRVEQHHDRVAHELGDGAAFGEHDGHGHPEVAVEHGHHVVG